MLGPLKKMRTELEQPVRYQLPIGDELLPLNEILGKRLTLHFSGDILCTHCGRKTNKSFSQGHCFPCFRKLAACDMCIMKPEQCHYFEGTCREPDWADQHCMQHHIVYLANSSGLKVGITRASQVPTRWIDQGAVQALPIFRVVHRLQSGLLEHALKAFVADKTNWRAMLKGMPELKELTLERDRLLREAESVLQPLLAGDAETVFLDEPVISIEYPVLKYPDKVSSLSLDKTPTVSGVLQGIKGQYLIFDCGVINIRKFGGYVVDVVEG